MNDKGSTEKADIFAKVQHNQCGSVVQTHISFSENKAQTFDRRAEIRRELDTLASQFDVTIITSILELENFTFRGSEENNQYGAGYVRFASIHLHDDLSQIAAQIQQIIGRSQTEGINLPVIFADSAISGNKTELPGLTACLTAMKGGNFQFLYAKNVDRLTRRPDKLMAIFKDLESNGVKLRISDQSFDFDSPEGKLLLQIIGSYSEFISSNRYSKPRKNRRTQISKRQNSN